MKKLDSFSSVGIFLANALTAVLVLGMWLATHNVWLTVGSLILLPFAMMKLFNRNVNTSYKVLVAILTLILFGMFAYFFRYKVEEPKTISDGPTVVITEDNKNGEDDDTPKVEEQEVIVSNTNGWNRRSSKPTAQESITPTYFNTGGSSKRGGSVNTGVSKVTSDKPAEIVVEEDNQEQAQKIADEVKEGKDAIDLNKGATAVVDNRESEEEKQEGNTTGQDNKDNENKLDTTNKKVEKLDPQPEPEVIPAPLPKTEQLKKDMTEMSENELEDLVKNVKPTVDTQPETTQEEKSSDKISEETTSSKDATKTEDTNATTPDKDESTNVSQEASDNKQDTKPAEPTTTDDTKTVVTEPEEVVTPAQPEYTPVGIQSLDGPTAMAGDTVQFKVTGDVKSVDGFDGLSYTNSNGYISVETKANESTVLTPVVTGQDGSTATTSVVVNVLNGQ